MSHPWPLWLRWTFGELHWTVVSIGIGASALFVAGAIRHRPRPTAPPDRWPSISVLKPFDGSDPGQEENFRSWIQHDYPGPVEVLFCTGSANDAGVAVVEHLRAEPRPEGTEVLLLVGDEASCDRLSRKVWHQERGARAAVGEVVINADSGIRRHGGELCALVSSLHADSGIGAAWASYTVAPGPGVGAALARIAWGAGGLNFVVVEAMRRWQRRPSILAGGLFAMPRAWVERLGWFAPLDGWLSEDLELGRQIVEAGGRVELAPTLATRHLDGEGLAGFMERQARWAAITWTQKDPFRWVSPIALSSLVIVPWTLALGVMAFPERLVEYTTLAVVLVAVRLAVAKGIARVTQQAVKAADLLWLPVLDAVLLYAAIRAPFVTRIRWRVEELEVSREGRVRPLRGS